MGERRHTTDDPTPDHSRAPTTTQVDTGRQGGAVTEPAAMRPRPTPPTTEDILHDLRVRVEALESQAKAQPVRRGAAASDVVPESLRAQWEHVLSELKTNRAFQRKVLHHLGQMQENFVKGPLTDMVRAYIGEETAG